MRRTHAEQIEPTGEELAGQPCAVLPFPQGRDDVRGFCARHHPTQSCPGVWEVAYVRRNGRGRLCAVIVCGPPPTPSIARALVTQATAIPRVAWVARMCAAGISGAELDALMACANRDLERRGYWLVLTMTTPTAWVMDGIGHALRRRLSSRGYTGDVYARNGWLSCGQTSPRSAVTHWVVDGRVLHCRQGRRTLSSGTIRDAYPDACDIRRVTSTGQKQRWIYVLGGRDTYAVRLALIAYPIQQPQPAVQLRLLSRATASPLIHVA